MILTEDMAWIELSV